MSRIHFLDSDAGVLIAGNLRDRPHAPPSRRASGRTVRDRAAGLPSTSASRASRSPGNLVVRVEPGLAQAGKMLAAAHTVAVAEAAQKLARIEHVSAWAGPRRCARSERSCDAGNCRSSTGAKSVLNPERAHLFADQAAMLAEERLRSARRHLGDRGHRRDHVAQAIDGAALHIDAEEQRRRRLSFWASRAGRAFARRARGCA